MGHEAAGIDRRVGAGVSNFKPGDRVTFDSTVYCGECDFCRRGDVNLCDSRQVLGVSCGDYRRARRVRRIRRGAGAHPLSPARRMSFAEAAMLEAVSVALHAVRVTEINGGETALVIGAGMIGLLTMQALRAAGCSRIFVADIDATRLNSRRSLGADRDAQLSGAD